MTGWQDISTAPKDGTPVLLYAPTREEPYQCGMWITSEDQWTGETLGCWWIADGRYSDEPTLWAPVEPVETRPC